MRDNWHSNTLGGLAFIQKGKISEQSKYPRKGFAPILNTDFLRGDIHVWGKLSGSVIAEKEDILILWDGERSGLVAIGYEGVLGSTFAKIRVSKEVYPEYLYRFLDHKFSWIQNQRTGTGVPHVPKDLDRILYISFPPLPQQRKIARILSTADAVIEQTEAAIAKYQALKQGLIQDLFSRGIDPTTGQLRPSPSEAPELFQQTELGLIPKDWEVKRLGDIGPAKMCKRIFSYQTSQNGDIPFFKIGTFGKKPDAFISKKLFLDYKNKYSFPTKGTVLISASGTIGRLVIYNGEDAYFQDSNIVWIENNNQLLSNAFLKFVFPLVKFKTEGGTIKRLYNDILLNGLFPYPNNSDEQSLIVKKLETISKKIQTEEAALAKYRQLKAGLMQDLLSGKVEVEGEKEVVDE